VRTIKSWSISAVLVIASAMSTPGIPAWAQMALSIRAASAGPSWVRASMTTPYMAAS
jgi:hypothetical protein